MIGCKWCMFPLMLNLLGSPTIQVESLIKIISIQIIHILFSNQRYQKLEPFIAKTGKLIPKLVLLVER
jgi:hypothetical protein